jgi:hypothetical protein
MNLFLLLIPVLFSISFAVVYRFVGRKEIFRFDLVQFFYAFILVPLMFIWGKILIFVLIRTGLNTSLSDTHYLMVDTIYGLIFLYIFGFEMVHALTKTVSLNVLRDPLYDIFIYLEYFHLWLAHLVCSVGSILLVMIFSLVNLFFPLDAHVRGLWFNLFLVSGLVFGWLAFMLIWLCNPHQGKRYRYMRIMKIMIGVLFISQVVGYAIASPSLSAQFAIYWWVAMASTVMVACAFLSYRSTRVKNWLEQISHQFKHQGWEFRAQLE